MKKAVFLIFTVFCSAVVCASVGDELESIKGDMPGCAIGVVGEEGLLLEKYRGYSSLKYNVPINEKTIFNIGSISKHITAAVFFRLEKMGLINRAETLSTYYPNGPEWFGDITLGHLITHRSGIPDFLNDEEFATSLVEILASDLTIVTNLLYGLPVSQGDIVAIVQSGISHLEGPTFNAGSMYSYSNTGYLLLADIINTHTDHSLSFWANQFIFAAYGMDSTSIFSETAEDLKWLATGYARSPFQGQTYRSLVELLLSQGDGNVLTTIDDFSKWIAVLNSSDSIDSEWYGFLVDPAKEHVPSGDTGWYQNGLTIDNYNGLIYGHDGFSMNNMASSFWVSPQHNVGYVRFCNFDYQRGSNKFDVFKYVTGSGIMDSNK